MSANQTNAIDACGHAAAAVAHWTPQFLAAAAATNTLRRNYCEDAARQAREFASVLYDADDYVMLYRTNRQRDLSDRFFVRAYHLERSVNYQAIGHDPDRYGFALQFVARDESVDRAAALGSRSVFVVVCRPDSERALETLKAVGLPAPTLVIRHACCFGVRAFFRTDRVLAPQEFMLVQNALSMIVNGSRWSGNVNDSIELPGVAHTSPSFDQAEIVPSATRPVYQAGVLLDRISDLVERWSTASGT